MGSRRPKNPTICPFPSCPLPGGECRDPDHRAGGWDPRRGTRHERGYGKEWTRSRRRILRRDRICQICLLVPATEVDHVVPKSQGGGDEDENLRGVCRACHATKTNDEARRARGTNER